MHGIASAVSAIQEGQYSHVLVGALGGHMSKHAVGVYSCTPEVVTGYRLKKRLKKLEIASRLPQNSAAPPWLRPSPSK